MQTRMRGKKVGVEKIAKSTSGNSLFAMPEDNSCAGVIAYLGNELTSSDLKVGMKVYFGDKRQQVRIEGKDIQVMDEDNVLAITE